MINHFERILTEVVDCQGEVTIYSRYSGRGMYGAKCPGITGTEEMCKAIISEFVKQAAAETNARDDISFSELVDQVLNYSQDSMGLRVIFYWPGVDAFSE